MSECVYVFFLLSLHVYMSVRESVYLGTMEVKQTWVVLCWLHSSESCVSSTQGTEREGREGNREGGGVERGSREGDEGGEGR